MDAASTRTLTRYNAWANELMFKAVAALPPGEAIKPRTSLFRNMVHTLNHNYVVDRIWQAHLQGREHGYDARNTKDHPPLEELWRLQREVDAWYVDWSDRLSDPQVDESIRFVLIGGNAGEMTRGEILLHILGHRHYHRGFVCDMMFEVPARPPTMDLPVYLREHGRERA
ncbi:MAG: damage-inducible protein DinB [Betaproteobacteria bacterium]|nr:MAG: damage-inducible protein DinB [Betaproteobacteria bacterium]